MRNSGKVSVLHDVSFSIERGSITCIIGPSGCGKSTFLSIVAGYQTPTSGTVLVNGKPVSGPSAERMMVFQQSTLFPWQTAEENISFGLTLRKQKRPKEQVRSEALALIKLVGLEGAGDRYPHELSGGMRQRIEIARALAVNPEVLLMDEPLGALDALTRLTMQREILKIWEQTGKTIVLITHDIGEAVIMADQIVVMSQRPASIQEIINVDLPRPRTRDDPEAARLGHHIAELLDATF